MKPKGQDINAIYEYKDFSNIQLRKAAIAKDTE